MGTWELKPGKIMYPETITEVKWRVDTSNFRVTDWLIDLLISR